MHYNHCVAPSVCPELTLVEYFKFCLWPCPLADPVLAGWVMVFVALCPGTPEAQPAVVLVLKSLRRRVNGLKSHPTDCFDIACNSVNMLLFIIYHSFAYHHAMTYMKYTIPMPNIGL